MARSDHIQTKQGDQDSNGGLTLAKCKELSAEITKNALRSSQVTYSLIIFADLPGTDRELPRYWQGDVSKGENPLKSFAPEAKYRSQRSAGQFNGNLSEESGGRNRN